MHVSTVFHTQYMCMHIYVHAQNNSAPPTSTCSHRTFFAVDHCLILAFLGRVREIRMIDSETEEGVVGRVRKQRPELAKMLEQRNPAAELTQK